MNTTNKLMGKYVKANLTQLKLIQSLLPYQQEALISSHSHKAIIATRRAGKSHAASVALICAALNRPNAVCYYLALTRASAKKIAWKTIKQLCRDYNIQCTFSESDLTATFRNGGSITLYGINSDGLLDNLRGTAIDLAVLDEAASFRGGIVEELIDEVLEPAFADYDGKLMLIGTPGAVSAGYFYDATTGEKSEYDVYTWNLRNNTHIAKGDPEGWVEKHRIRKGWSPDNPKFLREYCGQWSATKDAQVYKFKASRNVGELPSHTLTHHILGIDLGYDDDMAFVVIGYNPSISKKVYVVHTYSKSQMLISDALVMAKELQAKYKPHSTVIDQGGLGKAIAEDWKAKHGLSCEPAKKSDKRGYIETMNSDFHEGNIIIPSANTKLKNELINLLWDDETCTKEASKYPNHLCDALLYAWRKAYSYTFKESVRAPRLTVDEQVRLDLEAMDAAALEAESKDWWDI